MKIKEIKLNKFKRFTDLTITQIPQTAKLVILVGPNGCGKTSVFEGFYHWYKHYGFYNYGNKDYYINDIEGTGTLTLPSRMLRQRVTAYSQSVRPLVRRNK